MTYLELVQHGMLLSRIGDARLDQQPSSFANATGAFYEMIQWIALADIDIQRHRNSWLFMRGSADLLLPSGASTLVPSVSDNTIRAVLPAEDCGGRRSIGVYKDSVADESPVALVDYERWYGNRVGRGTQQTSGRPSRYTERNGTLLFDSIADQNYRITFDFIRKPTRMPLENSESVIPSDHHMAIVYWAIFHYYTVTRNSTSEDRVKFKAELDREMNRLYNNHLPNVTTA